jgi:flagellin-like protein
MDSTTRFDTEARGVSSVVGVVLLVAVTVVLAAVIGTFVVGLGNDVNTNAQAGVTFDQSEDGGTDVTVTVNSKLRVDGFKILVSDGGGYTVSDNAATQFVDKAVGDRFTVSGVDEGATITVVATYDGNTNVVGEYVVT